MRRTIRGYLNHITYCLLPEDAYLALLFRIKCGFWSNLKEPKTFREKMFWLLKYYNTNQTELIQTCYDKYTVREYVTQKVGSQYLVPLLAHYQKPEEIDISALPNEFVIKITQSCGKNLIVLDKDRLDETETMERVSEWWEASGKQREQCEIDKFHYTKEHPTIIAEMLLKPENNAPLNDYKIYCFNGKVEFTRVAVNPMDENGRRKKEFVYNTYDRDWNFLDFNTGNEHGADPSVVVEKPELLEELYAVAESLSADFSFARVDLYYFDRKIYFGEITFFPGSYAAEMRPSEWDVILGNKLSLPDLN